METEKQEKLRVQDFTSKFKRGWFFLSILGVLLIIGSNFLAQKLLYQEKITSIDNRLSIIEQKRKADDSLTAINNNKNLKVLERIELNLRKNICPKLGIEYMDIPNVYGN
jgi:hypothetical protein